MPIYQYRCNDCDNVTEKLCKVGANDSVRCSVCNGATSKIMSGSMLDLRGDGFCLTSSDRANRVRDSREGK